MVKIVPIKSEPQQTSNADKISSRKSDITSSPRSVSNPKSIVPVDRTGLSQNDIDAIASAVISKTKQKDDPLESLSPGAKELVKTVQSIGVVKEALSSPVQNSIEQSMSVLVSSILQTSLNNMLAPQQPAPVVQAQPKLLNTLAQIAVNNVSQNLPQILQTAKEVFGEARVQRGYDASLNYFEQKQASESLPQVVLSLDPNNIEHVEYYAKLMGLTNIKVAQQSLDQHKRALINEVQEYQNVQTGAYQESTAPQEVVYQEPVYEEPSAEYVIQEQPQYGREYAQPEERPSIYEVQTQGSGLNDRQSDDQGDNQNGYVASNNDINDSNMDRNTVSKPKMKRKNNRTIVMQEVD